MTQAPLVAQDLELVCSVLRQHPEIESAILFGSRAKGTHTPLRCGSGPGRPAGRSRSRGDRRRTRRAASALSL